MSCGLRGTIHQRIARRHALAFLHVDVDAARQRVFALLAVVAHDVDLALALRQFAVLDHAVDLGHDRALARLARFEQFDHARQTAGDVLGLRGFARNLRDNVARVHFFAVMHHQVRMRRHEVLAGAAGSLDLDHRLPLFIRRIGNHELRHAGDFVDLLGERDALLQIFEMHDAGKLGQDRERVGIPFEQDLVRLDRIAFGDRDARAVNYRIAFFFALLVVDNREDAVAVHRNDFALFVANPLDVDVLRETVRLRVLLRLLGDSGRRAADVERTHGELRAGFADRLRRDHADRFAALDQTPGRQVASVAGDANAALRFAGQHRADLDALDTGRLNRRRQFFGDFLIDRHDDVAFVIALIFESHAADDAVAQRFDDFARFDDRFDHDAFRRAAIVFADDHVLRHVDQTPREVTGVGRLERRIRQTLTRAVRRDEVLQHVEAFAEVRRDRAFR